MVMNLIRPAGPMTDDWSSKDVVIAGHMERVMGNLVAQLTHDNPSDVVLSAFFIGLIMGHDPAIAGDVARAMWRMVEESFGKQMCDQIRGATGGLVLEIRKVIRRAR